MLLLAGDIGGTNRSGHLSRRAKQPNHWRRLSFTVRVTRASG